MQEVVDDIKPLAGTSLSCMFACDLANVHGIRGSLLQYSASVQALRRQAWRRESCRTLTPLVTPSTLCCGLEVIS